MNGLDVLTAMRTQNPTVTVVMITAYGTVERAVQAMKQGAHDFVLKPFAPDHLSLIVQKALEWERLRSQVHVLAEAVDQRYRLVGDRAPPCSRRWRRPNAWRAARPPSYCWGKAVPAKNSSPMRSTPGVRARPIPLLPSTVSP